jgi:hypothetical protein
MLSQLKHCLEIARKIMLQGKLDLPRAAGGVADLSETRTFDSVCGRRLPRRPLRIDIDTFPRDVGGDHGGYAESRPSGVRW